MIDFRTTRNKDTLFVDPYLNPSDTSCGIYDNGLVFHYGRELSEKEIAMIR